MAKGMEVRSTRSAALSTIALICLPFFFSVSQAQTGTLTGRVTYQDDGTSAVSLKITAWQKGIAHSTTTDQNGNYSISGLITDVKATDHLPLGYSISQNYPNPFNPRTRIQITLPTQSQLQIDVYNLLGQHIASTPREAQVGTINIDQDLEGFAEGIYFFKIAVNNQYHKVLKGIYLRHSQHLQNTSSHESPAIVTALDNTTNTKSGVDVDSLVVDKQQGNARTTITNIPVFQDSTTHNVSIRRTYVTIIKPYKAHLWQDTLASRTSGIIILDDTDTLATGIDGKVIAWITKGEPHKIHTTTNNDYERTTYKQLETNTQRNQTTRLNISVLDKDWFPQDYLDKFNAQWKGRTNRGLTGFDTDSTDYQTWWLDTTNISTLQNPQVILDTVISVINSIPKTNTPVHEDGIYKNIIIVIAGHPPWEPVTGYPQYINYRLIQFKPITGGGIAATGIDWLGNNKNKTIFEFTYFDPEYGSTGQDPHYGLVTIQKAIRHELWFLGDGGLETAYDPLLKSYGQAPVEFDYRIPTDYDTKALFIKGIRRLGNTYIPGGIQDNDNGLDREPNNTIR